LHERNHFWQVHSDIKCHFCTKELWWSRVVFVLSIRQSPSSMVQSLCSYSRCCDMKNLWYNRQFGAYPNLLGKKALMLLLYNRQPRATGSKNTSLPYCWMLQCQPGSQLVPTPTMASRNYACKNMSFCIASDQTYLVY
jgi:hypothetical protein